MYGTPQPAYGKVAGAAGSSAAWAKQPFAQRRQTSLAAVLLCLAGPCSLFAAVCAPLSFTLHSAEPLLAWTIVAAGLSVALLCCYLAYVAVRKRLIGDMSREPFWYVFLAVTMLLAWGFAVYVGGVNWVNNIAPYDELQKLSTHPAVDPAAMSGRQLMDVGRAVFANGSTLDQRLSIGFKNIDQYCVAPIVRGSTKPKSYDLWAVGINCCSGMKSGFRCGEYSNPNARAGLRLMREDQRGYYQLAVQQAEAAYNIKAEHPVFFHWLQDPLAEMESYKADATKYYLLGLLTFSASQVLLVILALVCHSKL